MTFRIPTCAWGLVLTCTLYVSQVLGTVVSDNNIYSPSGTALFGTITLTLSSKCTGPGNLTVSPTPIIANVVRGAVTVTLQPNDTCAINGVYTTYYSATYDLYIPGTNSRWRKTGLQWYITTSGSPVTIESVETIPPTTSPISTLPVGQITGADENAIAFGTAGGALAFGDLFWDDSTGRLGVGITPESTVHIKGPSVTQIRVFQGDSQGSNYLMAFYNPDNDEVLSGIGVDGGYATSVSGEIKASLAGKNLFLSGDGESGLYWCAGTHLGACGDADVKIARDQAGVAYIASFAGGYGGQGGIKADYHIQSTTAATPTDFGDPGSYAVTYVKDTFLIVRYNHSGTMKYRYLDLSSTNATWQYSTTNPAP